MNGKTSKALVATAIGLLIGIAMAFRLQTINSWLPWISPFVGGIFGYLSYEFRTVWKTVGQAWSEVSEWQITKEGTLEFLRVIRIIILSLITWLILGVNFIIVLAISMEKFRLDAIAEPVVVLTLSLVTGFVFFGAGAALHFDRQGVPLKYYPYLKYSLLRMNPLAIFIYWPARFIIWGVPKIPPALRKVRIFTTTFFLLIHSQRRLIIFTWVFLGVSAFILSNAFWPCFIGGLAGCALSIELIGKRWLKTLPALNGA